MSDAVDRLNTALEGRYAIERELGEGGMATVYLADDLKHERKVALKVLKPELAAVVGAERFLAEIKTTANLTHPHILPLFDSGEADSFLFYVMPHIEGESLRERIDREKQLGVDDSVAITQKVANALDYAHGHGVVHRDIKPGNILLSEQGEPLVADFGIALAVAQAGAGRITETGLSLGTPHYMSPEQATGDRDVDPRSDVYALGCVLYEMLAGQPPFSAPTAQAVLVQILTVDAPSVTGLRRTVPPHVGHALAQALEKLPADRFTSAAEFAAALGDEGFTYKARARTSVATSTLEPVAAQGPTTMSGSWNRLTITFAALFALTLAWSLLRPDTPRPLTRMSVYMPEDQSFDPSRGSFDLSADGSLLVYRGLGDEGQPLLRLRRWDALDSTPIRDTGGARRPSISPDGNEVVFHTGQGGGIRVVPLQGGVSRTLTEGTQARWSPDGAWIYYTNPSGGLSRMPSGGGTAEILTVVDTGEVAHEFVDVLPGGHAVYQANTPGSVRRIQAVDVETGEIKDVTEGRYPRYSATGHLLFQDARAAILLAAAFDVESLELTSAPLPIAESLNSFAPGTGNFAVSQRGRLVYRLGGGSGGLVPTWLGRNDSEEELDPTNFVGAFAVPRLSPDGRRVAVQNTPAGNTDPQIWIYDLDQKTFTRLTFEGANTRPFWSPSGAEVGFLSNRDGENAVYARAWDRSGEARLLRSGTGAPIFEALWTPNERWLVYEAQTPGASALGGDLYYASPHPDSAAVTILNTPFLESVPDVSPDGRWLVYQSDESGQDEVYVRPFPGPGGVIPVSVGGGTAPVWAHNGREIFYQSLDDNSWVVATVRTDPDFAVESQVPFARTLGFRAQRGTREFDVSPDDQRLLVLGSELRRVVELIFVDNWAAELRQRMGSN